MPITGPSSYVQTTQEFLSHWASADTALGAGNEIELPDGTDHAGLQTKLDSLIAKRSGVQSSLNSKEVARGDVEIKKAALITRVVQFNDKIRAFFPDSKWIVALPVAPAQTESQGRVVPIMDDVASLWQQINADPGTAAPVTLLGGYTQAMFATDRTALNTSYNSLNAAEQTLKLTREERNKLQDGIYQNLKSYRLVLPTFFAKDDALVASLPRLTPLPGSTPISVTLSGSWVSPPGNAVLNWTASSDPNLMHYELRVTLGPVYDTDSDTTVNIYGPGDLTASTLSGLGTPGDTASYKLYVITNTGNESGSNVVVITRPMA